MPTNSSSAREKILEAAQTLVLDKGFGGTTIDAIIEQADVSKGAFFHHFSSKDALGHVLVEQYANADIEHLDRTLTKAEGLSDDPLQQLLIFVKLFEQEMQELEDPFPGCLYASYLNQLELFDDTVKELIKNSMLEWRMRVKEKLEQIVTIYPLSQDIDLESLADMLLVIFEGAFILSQSFKEPKCVARQLSHYHHYLKLLFAR